MAPLTILTRALAALARVSVVVMAGLGSMAAGVSLGSTLSGPADLTTPSGGSITLTGRLSGTLYPDVSRPIKLTADNKGAAALRIATVQLQRVAADRHHRSCDTSDFSMQNAAEDVRVPAGDASYLLPRPGRLVYKDDGTNEDVCAGALLTLTFSTT